jgi:nitrate reductase NapAB chaperone NapD
MATPEQQPPFYERRWFQGAGAVVALVAALWALGGSLWDAADDKFSASAEKLALVNTEIVLDASASMAEPFGEGTKLDAAARAIDTYVGPLTNDGLALRRAGGSCSDSGDLLVELGTGNGEEINEEVSEQVPAGESNIVAAVRAAISDFGHPRFRGQSSTKRILVVMGGEDECAEDAASEIRDDLAGIGIEPVFRLVALKVSAEEMQRLKSFKRALEPYAEVEIRPADTEGQLEEVMEEEREEAAEASSLAAEEDEEGKYDAGQRALIAPEPEPELEPEGEAGNESESGGGLEPEPEPEVGESSGGEVTPAEPSPSAVPEVGAPP